MALSLKTHDILFILLTTLLYSWRLNFKNDPSPHPMCPAKCDPSKNTVPGDVTLSGSTVQPLLMNKYQWLGKKKSPMQGYLNGKPTYKYSTYFLYWEATLKAWVIGPTLGSNVISLHWSNDVLRPELSPNPTGVQAYAGKSMKGGWQDDTLKITASCVVAKDQSVKKSAFESGYYLHDIRHNPPTSGMKDYAIMSLPFGIISAALILTYQLRIRVGYRLITTESIKWRLPLFLPTLYALYLYR